MIKINSIKLPIGHSEQDLLGAILKYLKITENDLTSYRIQKRSLDARKKKEIHFVYSVFVEVKNQESLKAVIQRSGNIELREEKKYQIPKLEKKSIVNGQ